MSGWCCVAVRGVRKAGSKEAWVQLRVREECCGGWCLFNPTMLTDLHLTATAKHSDCIQLQECAQRNC